MEKVIDVMYEIEFNDEMTIDGIIESFKNLEDAGIESYIKIDGVKILWNDKDRDNKIKKVLQKHKTKRKQDNCINKKDNSINLVNTEVKENDDFERVFGRRLDLYYLSQNKLFLFEFGTVIKYTQSEYIDEMIEYYVSIYGVSSNNKKGIEMLRDLNYMSELILILNYNCTDVEKRFKIQEIINRISDNEDEKYKFDVSVRRIENYIIDGKKIRELLFLDILNDKLSAANDELNKKINTKVFKVEI